MKTADIQNPTLRAWVESYQAERVAAKRAEKCSSDDITSVWKSFNEADWGAFREVLSLRPRAAEVFRPDEVGLGPQTPEVWVERYIQDTFSPYVKFGCRYEAPYSLARERQALEALIAHFSPDAFPAVQVEWIP